MSRKPIQTRFPRLWLAAQQLIGGTRDKSALALRHYSGQARVLEIGCSLGNVSDAFRQLEGISYTGIDIDASAIAIARCRFSDRSNFRFETSPIEELSQKGERYDYVVIAGVLHHLDDRSAQSMIANSWAVTEPGGILVALHSDFDGLGRAFRLARAGVSNQRGPRCCEASLVAL
jgi:2-polyprenyl-3-methyl-5-hydroxy-6-metoxy-1,4-benzoquinol methylase